MTTFKRRVSFAMIAMTIGALTLQSAEAAQAAEATSSPTSEVLADVTAALADASAVPATEPSDAEAAAVDLPSTAVDAASVATDGGTLTMGVPAEGRDLTPASETTALFDGAGDDTAVVVQSTEEGVRALVHIDSPDAPERYEFPIGGAVAALTLTEDGGVLALDADNQPMAFAPAPWATDANGVPVATHYEIDGTTLVQVVEHHAGNYAYGIVADPWWNPFSWDWGKVWSVTKSALGSVITKCGAGAVKGVLGLGIATGTTNVLIEKVSSTVAKLKVGGLYGYVGVAVAGCIMSYL